MNSTSIKLYDIFRQDLKLSETKAKELVETFEESFRNEVATKDFVRAECNSLETKITKSIYWVSFIQFLAIIGAIMAIINFMK